MHFSRGLTPRKLGTMPLRQNPMTEEKVDLQSLDWETMVLRFEGHMHFRQRLVLSTLSQKSITIHGIRPHDDNPGLKGQSFDGAFVLRAVTHKHHNVAM